MPPFDNPNVIDVNLSVLGNSAAALTEFTNQLKTINEHMAALRDVPPAGATPTRQAPRPGGVQDRGQPSSRASVSSQAQEALPYGESASASTPTKAAESVNDTLRDPRTGWNFSQSQSGILRPGMVDEAVQRAQIQDQADRQERRSGLRNLPIFQHGIVAQMLGANATYGEIAGAGAGAYLGGRFIGGEHGLLMGALAGQSMGPIIDAVAPRIGLGEEKLDALTQSTRLKTLAAAGAIGYGFASREGLTPGSIEHRATALGFRPEQGFNVGGFGFQIPFSQYFSSAGAEARSQFMTELNLRALPNINRDQAQSIIQAISEAGYSGQERDRIAFGALAPLVQQGQNAQTLMPLLDQSIRYGTGSLQEFRATMNNIGDVARAVRLPMDQLQESMGQFAEAAMEHGATFQQGLAGARQFAEITGLNPQIGAQNLNSPLAQGLGMARFGLLPSQLGLLSGTGQTQLMGQEVDMALQLTQGFNVTHRIPIRNARGQVIGYQTISGQDAQDAQAASLLGMDINTFKRFRQQRQNIQARTSAEQAIAAWRGDFHDPRMNPARRAAFAGESGVSWNEVAGQLRRAGVSADEVSRISHMHYRDRAAAAQSALANVTRHTTGPNTKNVVEVKFTGTAEKIFQQVLSKAAPGGLMKTAVNAGEEAATHVIGAPAGLGIDAFHFIKHIF